MRLERREPRNSPRVRKGGAGLPGCGVSSPGCRAPRQESRRSLGGPGVGLGQCEYQGSRGAPISARLPCAGVGGELYHHRCGSQSWVPYLPAPRPASDMMPHSEGLVLT